MFTKKRTPCHRKERYENETTATSDPLSRMRKGRVIDAADGTDTSRLQLYGPDQAEKAELFSKCPKCGMQIGIAFQTSESR